MAPGGVFTCALPTSVFLTATHRKLGGKSLPLRCSGTREGARNSSNIEHRQTRRSPRPIPDPRSDTHTSVRQQQRAVGSHAQHDDDGGEHAKRRRPSSAARPPTVACEAASFSPRAATDECGRAWSPPCASSGVRVCVCVCGAASLRESCACVS
ncbi:hypothetical protein HPB50_009128 [Hyalomma asiaticum]|uniref:Uncharacterized protein n=1 Tax=Hyalomma asiaticum TaxID=266040 RepID=A0ACB7SU59_HYAAI|nr:hypothetical protein HPB50_009128 [Hyalomma asiaticum]